MLKKVKVSWDIGPRSPNLSQFTGNRENVIGEYKFFLNDEINDADFWFVMQGTIPGDDHCLVPHGQLIYLCAESSYPLNWFVNSELKLNYLKQFDKVLTNHFVPLPNVEYAFPFLPWMINSNQGSSILGEHVRDVNWLRQSSPPKKNMRISMICSDQQWTADHRMRFRFAQALKAHFGNRLDWFGNGVNSIPEKWNGLEDYPYTIVLENKAQSGTVTEKIVDAFLGFSYPLYWGAPNIFDVFPHGSLTKIDIFDEPSAIKVIEREVQVPYEDRLDAIAKARDVALNDFNFLNRIIDVCESIEATASSGGEQKRSVKLKSPSKLEARFDSEWHNPRRMVGNVVSGIGRRIGKTKFHP